MSMFRLVSGRAQADPPLCSARHKSVPRQQHRGGCPCMMQPLAAAMTTPAPWQHHKDPATASQHHSAEAVGAAGQE